MPLAIFLHWLTHLVIQVAGLFMGMVAVGFSVDRVGRKWGSISTAAIMFIGKLPTLHIERKFLIQHIHTE